MANFDWQYVAFGAAGAGASLYALYYIALAIARRLLLYGAGTHLLRT